MRKHKEEMVQFANSETEVWVKRENSNEKWKKIKYPNWYDNYHYIVDNKYAKLRMESIDTGRPIQKFNPVTNEWETPTSKLEFNAGIENYRLEPDEFSYPIYKRNKTLGDIIMFTDLTTGICVKNTVASYVEGVDVGRVYHSLIEHTDTTEWEDVEDNKIKELEKSKKFDYPIFKKSKKDGMVVEFTDLNTGKVIKTNSSDNKHVGFYSKNWIEHTKKSIWEDIKKEEIEEPEQEPVYYYKWEKLHDSGRIIETVNWVSDTYAESNNLKSDGWIKIENSKRTWNG